MVWRSYSCLNRNCRNEFNSEEDHPPCPRCRGMRVRWLPKPFAIGKVARGIDRTTRDLADTYGMSDIRSAVAGQSVKQATNPAGPSSTRAFAPANSPIGGVQVPDACLDPTRSKHGMAFCGPTGAVAPLKAGAMGIMEKAVPASKTLGAASRIEGSYRPEGGIPKGKP